MPAIDAIVRIMESDWKLDYIRIEIRLLDKFKMVKDILRCKEGISQTRINKKRIPIVIDNTAGWLRIQSYIRKHVYFSWTTAAHDWFSCSRKRINLISCAWWRRSIKKKKDIRDNVRITLSRISYHDLWKMIFSWPCWH